MWKYDLFSQELQLPALLLIERYIVDC